MERFPLAPAHPSGRMDPNHGKPVSETPTFSIKASLDGTLHTFPCRADQTVLAAAEAAGVPLPSSCCSGVCTTCAAKLSSGSVHQPDAMGVKAELRDQGYALLCVSYPLSDLELLAGQEDTLYEAQFGRYQK
jgi:ferredoxin